MRREVEIYINTAAFGETVAYSRLDVFSEESVNITNSIQDIRDIAKVFTDFTQQFSVPASSPNNLIFKHYYNFDIIGGYDARVKREALIKINGEDYKKGFLSLNSVSMKNGAPFAYKIVFYGKTVNLNLLFGDDELDDLASYPNAYLSQFNQSYSQASAQIGFTNGYNLVSGALQTNNDSSTAGDLCYPFMSSKSYYFWDTTNSGNVPVTNGIESRNLQVNATGNTKGLKMIDLKPAIRLYHIILGIEDKYGITFSKNGTNDFFSISNTSFYELYLWLHREKGDLASQISESVVSIYLNDYTLDPATQNDPRNNGNTSLIAFIQNFGAGGLFRTSYIYTVTVTPTGAGLYTLEMLDSASGVTLGSTEHSGTGTPVTKSFNLFISGNQTATQTFVPVFKVRTQGGITAVSIDSLTITIVQQQNSATPTTTDITYTYNNGADIPVSTGLDVVDNMPKMKVIDFLTSVFKMFNLTAFYDGEIIKVRTLDNFYTEGTSHDISEYVHADKHNVDKANIFSKIDFEYQKASTFAIVNSNEITNDEFGNERLSNRSAEINNPLSFDGGTYTVKLGFEHVLYERMRNQTDSTDETNIQWGWMVSKDQNTVLGKPLVFYCHKQNTSAEPINIEVSSSSHQPVTDYIKPANTLGNNLQTINFGSEIDEYFGGENTVSLFKTFYFNYIVPIYNEKSRLSKFEATLPLRLVTKLELNDKLIISGRSYKINKIQMNINTGKATLELINEV